MEKLVGTYSLKNLIQSTEFLLDITKNLNDAIIDLEKNRDEVRKQQKEATNQGFLVKKMANYMSEEITRIEKDDSIKELKIPANIEKLSQTEKKLSSLRKRLSEFIEGESSDALAVSENSLSVELKQYESFLLSLTTTINEKIANLEKISSRIIAEKRESEQQKVLLKEMVELFSQEIEDLEQTLKEIKN